MTDEKEKRNNLLNRLFPKDLKKTANDLKEVTDNYDNYDGYHQLKLPFDKLPFDKLPFNDGYFSLSEEKLIDGNSLSEEELSEEELTEEELTEVQRLFDENPLSKEELIELQQLFDTSIVDNKILKLLNFKKHYSKICSKYFYLRFQMKTFQSGNSNLLTESFFDKWFDIQIQYEIINKAFSKILEEFQNSDLDLKDFFSISEEFNYGNRHLFLG